jgi:hypothetical protein
VSNIHVGFRCIQHVIQEVLSLNPHIIAGIRVIHIKHEDLDIGFYIYQIKHTSVQRHVCLSHTNFVVLAGIIVSCRKGGELTLFNNLLLLQNVSPVLCCIL